MSLINIDGFFPLSISSTQKFSNNPKVKPAAVPIGPARSVPIAILAPKYVKFLRNFPPLFSKVDSSY